MITLTLHQKSHTGVYLEWTEDTDTSARTDNANLSYALIEAVRQYLALPEPETPDLRARRALHRILNERASYEVITAEIEAAIAQDRAERGQM